MKKLGFEVEPSYSYAPEGFLQRMQHHCMNVVTPVVRKAVESAIVLTADDAEEDDEFLVVFRVKIRRTG